MEWFTKQIEEGTKQGTKREITVCFDQEYNIAPGITFGQFWNGGECPFFTKAVANQVCKGAMGEDDSYRYDEEQDAFILKFDNWEDEEVYPSYMIDGVKYYPIGNGSFTWEELVL